MRVVFRADASLLIGIGHLMRCLTLANELQNDGGEVAFICRDLPDNLVEVIRAKGYRLHNLPPLVDKGQPQWIQDAQQSARYLETEFTDVDWLIVDHYRLDLPWESRLRCHCRQLMVIDDLADRSHDCDLLLDQNFYQGYTSRYDGLVPSHCQRLLGPGYSLLRPEFQQARSGMRERDGLVRRMLVFFGGSDSLNLTQVAIDAIDSLASPDIVTDVVVGGLNPYRESIEEYCHNNARFNFHTEVKNMAELIALADLAVAAGGSTMWERCFLGLPSITVVFADNQERTTMDVAQEGAILFPGWAQDLKQADYSDAISTMMHRPDKMRLMSKRALELMGGERYLGTPAVAAALKAGADRQSSEM